VEDGGGSGAHVQAPCEGDETANGQNRLLTLMGVPWLQAPSEAGGAVRGAACASGSRLRCRHRRHGRADIRAPVLLRRLTFSEAKKMPIQEFRLDKALQEMSMSQEQFVDLCILLGCDYCDSLFAASGRKRRWRFLRKYGDIDNVLKHLDKDKYQVELPFKLITRTIRIAVPENWQYQEGRRLGPSRTKPASSNSLVEENGFNEERVRRSGAKRLLKAKQTTVQGRIDSFLLVLQPPPASSRFRRPETEVPGRGWQGPALIRIRLQENSSFKRENSLNHP
uniref:XPGI domain-containing protein n=1 Tax=Macrostomum lignano TaxID=282301 RepID=A0A1I8FBS0_9PLAT